MVEYSTVSLATAVIASDGGWAPLGRRALHTNAKAPNKAGRAITVDNDVLASSPVLLTNETVV